MVEWPEPDPLPREITESETAAYRDDGVVRLRGVMSDLWTDQIEAAVRDFIANPSAVRDCPYPPGAFIGEQYLWKRIDAFRDFAFGSPAARIAGAVLGSETINLFNDQIFIKLEGCVEP